MRKILTTCLIVAAFALLWNLACAVAFGQCPNGSCPTVQRTHTFTRFARPVVSHAPAFVMMPVPQVAVQPKPAAVLPAPAPAQKMPVGPMAPLPVVPAETTEPMLAPRLFVGFFVRTVLTLPVRIVQAVAVPVHTTVAVVKTRVKTRARLCP